MQTIQYKITDANGIHARPAGMLVKAASGFSSEITIRKGEKSADAKRLFGVMGLGVKSGDEITVALSGEDEVQAKDALEQFLKAHL